MIMIFLAAIDGRFLNELPIHTFHNPELEYLRTKNTRNSKIDRKQLVSSSYFQSSVCPTFFLSHFYAEESTALPASAVAVFSGNIFYFVLLFGTFYFLVLFTF